jgi:hypothetical protein
MKINLPSLCKYIIGWYIACSTSYAGIVNIENIYTYDAPDAIKTWIRDFDGENILGTYINSSNIQQAFLYNKNTSIFRNLNVGGTGWGDAASFQGNNAIFQSGWHTTYRYNLTSGIITNIDEYPGKADADIGSFDPLNNNRYVGTWANTFHPYISHPYLFNGTSFIDIPILAGHVQAWAGGVYGSKVIGVARTGPNYSAGVTNMFIYDENTGITSLLNLPTNSNASDIYDKFVVGFDYILNLETNTYDQMAIPGASKVEVLSINGDRGLLEVTGLYIDSNGTQRGFIGTVPEPSALSLLAVGIGGLAMLRRRRS